MGALAYLQKPVTHEALVKTLVQIKGFVERPVKNLLLVIVDEGQRQSIVDLIGNSDVATTAVETGAAALELLRANSSDPLGLPYDCVVLDIELPEMSGFELIEQITQEFTVGEQGLTPLPIIIYSSKSLTKQQQAELKRFSEITTIKQLRSPESLLNETALFLHRVQANLPEPKRQMIEKLYQIDPLLTGKKVLIVDDDVRNIFALTSMLERHQMQVLYAENGADGIAMLQNIPDIEVVLMDVMMPEMDGYETMRQIRKITQFRSLPMIALTAKAMKGDREKCLEAGASDYITKPVDTEQLLSLLRVWLY